MNAVCAVGSVRFCTVRDQRSPRGGLDDSFVPMIFLRQICHRSLCLLLIVLCFSLKLDSEYRVLVGFQVCPNDKIHSDLTTARRSGTVLA
jgi:hypothetical protein